MGKTLTDKDRQALLSNLTGTGIFVTLGLETPNIMVTHWGTLGKMWGREVFFLPIRSSKYSYKIATETLGFALNIPCRDMRSEIARCDTLSGFSCNKFEELNLHPKRARTIDAYVLGECGPIVECKIIALISPSAIASTTAEQLSTSNAHTLFVGEISDCYSFKK